MERFWYRWIYEETHMKRSSRWQLDENTNGKAIFVVYENTVNRKSVRFMSWWKHWIGQMLTAWWKHWNGGVILMASSLLLEDDEYCYYRLHSFHNMQLWSSSRYDDISFRVFSDSVGEIWIRTDYMISFGVGGMVCVNHLRAMLYCHGYATPCLWHCWRLISISQCQIKPLPR